MTATRPPRPRPRAEPAPERLVASARELFARDGYAGVSLDAVVAACGVTKGALYHHFTGKAELFEAVFEQEAGDLCERVAQAIARKRDPWEAAYAGIRACLRFSQEPGVQRIVLVDAPSVLGWQRVREIEARYGLALVKAAIARLIDAGEIAGRKVDPLGHLLFGALAEAALLIARADNPAAAQRRMERELRALVDGLAIRPRPR